MEEAVTMMVVEVEIYDNSNVVTVNDHDDGARLK